MDNPVARAALRTNAATLALGHDVFTADGGTFVRNEAYPAIRDANHVAHITAATPEQIDALLARAEHEFAHCPHRAYKVDFTTPPAFEARLQLDGYVRDDALVSVLEGPLIGDAKPHDIRPIEDEEGWRALASLFALDWAEGRARDGLPEAPEVGQAMAAANRAKSPPVRFWLAHDDGAPRGYFFSWGGVGGVGQVEDLFVQREYRHRGLATALIHRAVADARAQGAGPVVIVADPTDTPKHMYAAMGFTPVATVRNYRKELR